MEREGGFGKKKGKIIKMGARSGRVDAVVFGERRATKREAEYKSRQKGVGLREEIKGAKEK